MGGDGGNAAHLGLHLCDSRTSAGVILGLAVRAGVLLEAGECQTGHGLPLGGHTPGISRISGGWSGHHWMTADLRRSCKGRAGPAGGIGVPSAEGPS